MLSEKTNGNLHPQESRLLEGLLGDLRMQYVQLVRATEEKLKAQAAQKFSASDILGKKRNKEIVLPRQIAMYLAREMGSMSYPDIGRAFGRDYTTVIHSYEKIKTEVKRDSSLKGVISEIRSRAHARA